MRPLPCDEAAQGDSRQQQGGRDTGARRERAPPQLLDHRWCHVVWRGRGSRRTDRTRSRCNLFDRSDEPIASPWQRLDESRRAGRIAQGLANPRDGVVKPVVEVYEGVGGPERGPQITARDQLTGGREQECQYLDRLALQAHLHASFPQLLRLKIQLEDVEAENASRWNFLSGHT